MSAMTSLYRTAPNSECRETLQIRDGAVEPYKAYTVLRLKIPDLQLGDIVQVSAQFQATNDHERQVMLSHMLTRGALGESDSTGGWTVICPRSGENIVPETHHTTRSLAGAWEVEEVGEETVRLIAWASMRGATDHELTIDKGHGHICAIVHGQGDAPPVPEL